MTAAVEEIGRVFRKARAAMQGDAHAMLASALEKIKALRQRLEAIEAEQRHHAGRFDRRIAAARERYERTKSDDAEVAWLLEEAAKEVYQRKAAPSEARARLIYGIQTLPTAEGLAFEAFVKEHPDWRAPLQLAIDAKLEIVRAEHDRTLKIVHEQLSGFVEEVEELERDPRLRQAKHELSRAELLQSRFENAEGLAAWKLAVDELFPK
jgi:hypothetical protein